MVKLPEQWSWSSYPATAGLVKGPSWLASYEVLAWFSASRKRYRNFVIEGTGKGSVWEDLKGQIYLGDENFLERMQARAQGKASPGIAKAQTRPARPRMDETKRAVAEKYGIRPGEVLDRRRGEAYRAAVYLMRRQIVWNRSTRRAGVRGGAQVGRPRRLRILSITGGPSIPVLSLTKERVNLQSANVALLQCLETLLHLLSRDVLPV